jgi:hypothetical protein
MVLGLGAAPSWGHFIGTTDVGATDNLMGQADLANAGAAEITFLQGLLGTGVEILDQVQNVSYVATDTTDVYAFLLNPIGDYFMIKNAQWTALYQNIANMEWAVFDRTLLDSGFNIGTEGFTLSHIRVIDPVGVPEPATLSLLGVGLLAVGFARRRTAR